MQQLSALDASFLYLDTPNTPMHVGGLAIYDPSTAPGGIVRFKEILADTQKRLHLARSTRQKLVRVPLNLDHPYWIEDPKFDIEFHVRHIRLPAPGDWRQLCIQVARLHSRPIDENHPLWEMFVIEGLDNIPGVPEGSYAVYTKTHHAAIDGATGAELTAVMHDLSPEGTTLNTRDTWVPDRVPTEAELMTRAIGNNVRQPMKLWDIATNAAPGFAKVALNNLRGNDELKAFDHPVPRVRFNGRVGPNRVVEAIRFTLEDAKAIKNAVPGATINDAMLALVGGALRRYLDHYGELPDDSLVAMAPINVRTKDQEGTGGNQVSQMLVTMRSDIENGAERLAAVHEGTSKSKAMTDAIGARNMTDMTQFLPSSLAGLAARLYTRLGVANQARPFFNCVVTNVPGPQVPLFASGAKMLSNFGLGPIFDGVGLIHAITSYNGEIAVTIVACRQMMPDPDYYAECMQASLDEMKASCAAAAEQVA